MTKKERYTLGRLMLWLEQIHQSAAAAVIVTDEIKEAMGMGARQLMLCLTRHYKKPVKKAKKKAIKTAKGKK